MKQLKAQDILLAPIISEKSYEDSDHGKYRFRVHRDATKLQVKEAVETLFKTVKVDKINMSWVRGKTKRMRGKIGKTQDWKKAVVTLKGDARLDFFEKV